MIHFDKFFSNNYLKGSIILIILMLAGILMNTFIGIKFTGFPGFPFNLYILLALTFSQIFLFYQLKKNKLIEWLSKPSFLIVAFFGFIFCKIFLQFFREKIFSINPHVIINPMLLTSGWVDLFLRLFLLTCLCFSLLKHLFPIKGKYLGIIFLNLGIWLVLNALWFGLADKQELSINLIENGEKCNYGISKTEKIIELPFFIQLIDFKLVNNKYPVLSKDYWKNKYYTHIQKIPDMSTLMVISSDSIRNDTVLVTPYKHLNIKGWKLYPVGYDESKGQQSTLGTIRAEKDYWKNVTGVGYISIFCGLIFIFIYKKPKTPHSTFLPTHYQ